MASQEGHANIVDLPVLIPTFTEMMEQHLFHGKPGRTY